MNEEDDGDEEEFHFPIRLAPLIPIRVSLFMVSQVQAFNASPFRSFSQFLCENKAIDAVGSSTR